MSTKRQQGPSSSRSKAATDWDWHWSLKDFNRDHWWGEPEHKQFKCLEGTWYEVLRRHPLAGEALRHPRVKDGGVLKNDPYNLQGKPGFSTTWEIVRASIIPEVVSVDLANLISIFCKKNWIQLPKIHQKLFVEVLSHYSFAKGLPVKARVTPLRRPSSLKSADDVQFVTGAAELAAKAGKLVYAVDLETSSPEDIIAQFSAFYRAQCHLVNPKRQRWQSWLSTVARFEDSEATRRGQLLGKDQVSKKGENQKLRLTYQSLFRQIEF